MIWNNWFEILIVVIIYNFLSYIKQKLSMKFINVKYVQVVWRSKLLEDVANIKIKFQSLLNY